MTLSRGRPTLVGTLLAAALLAVGCAGSDPATTDSPEPAQTATSMSPADSVSPSRRRSSSPTPSTSPTPPPLPMVGWGDGRYVVPCLPGDPTVAFEDGKDTLRTSDTITARVVARGVLASYQSVAIHIVCTGASSSPSSVLVYIGALEGPNYVGLALSPKEYIDLKRARYVDEELEIIGYGFTRSAPMCCPDLKVTKVVALENGRLVRISLIKEPLAG